MNSSRPWTRALTVQWLRNTHGWLGLWGATLGLLFGISGIWLNHRAVLKLPIFTQRSEMQLALPDPAPKNAAALAAWLQTALQLDAPANNIRSEPAKPVAWLERDKSLGSSNDRQRNGQQDKQQDERERQHDKTHDTEQNSAREPAQAPIHERAPNDAATPPMLMQPEHWTINFGGPHLTLQAETWAGNRSVSIRRIDNGIIGTLTNLHKGIGMPIGWILLVDTLAGSLILLSLSGLALWLLTHRRRTVGAVIFGAGLVATVGLAGSRL